MDSNFRNFVFLVSFSLNSAHVVVALLVIKASPMVLYPLLRMAGEFDPLARPKHISP